MKSFNDYIKENQNEVDHDELWNRNIQQIGNAMTVLKGALSILQQDVHDGTGYRDKTIASVQNCIQSLGLWYKVANNLNQGETG